MKTYTTQVTYRDDDARTCVVRVNTPSCFYSVALVKDKAVVAGPGIAAEFPRAWRGIVPMNLSYEAQAIIAVLNLEERT